MAWVQHLPVACYKRSSGSSKSSCVSMRGGIIRSFCSRVWQVKWGRSEEDRRPFPRSVTDTCKRIYSLAMAIRTKLRFFSRGHGQMNEWMKQRTGLDLFFSLVSIESNVMMNGYGGKPTTGLDIFSLAFIESMWWWMDMEGGPGTENHRHGYEAEQKQQ